MPLLRYGVKAVGGWSIWCSGGGLGVGCGIGVARTLRLPGLRQQGLRHAQAATMMGRYQPPLNLQACERLADQRGLSGDVT